jgi:hypothetical protein
LVIPSRFSGQESAGNEILRTPSLASGIDHVNEVADIENSSMPVPFVSTGAAEAGVQYHRKQADPEQWLKMFRKRCDCSPLSF